MPFRDSETGFQVPILLATGKERDQVLELADRQLERVAQALPPVTDGSPTVPVPDLDAVADPSKEQ